MSAWQAGGPGLHRPLDKLLGTWTGVYPQAVLADIQSRVAAARAAAAAAAVQAPAAAGGFAANGGYGFAPTAPVAPMVADPRLAQQQQFQQQQQQQPAFGAAPQPYVQAPAYPQQAVQPMGGYAAPMQQQPMQPTFYQQPPAQQQPMMQPQAVQQPAAVQQQVNVPDLLSSLMNAGLLSAPGAAPPAAPLQQHSTPPYASAAVTATPEREQPASTKLTPDRIKVLVGRPRRPHYFASGPPKPHYAQPTITCQCTVYNLPCMRVCGRCTPGIHPSVAHPCPMPYMAPWVQPARAVRDIRLSSARAVALQLQLLRGNPASVALAPAREGSTRLGSWKAWAASKGSAGHGRPSSMLE